MRCTTAFATTFLAVLLELLGPAVARAQIVLADIAGNYATTGTLTDTHGAGSWTYYASTAASGGTLTALTYGSIGNAGNYGYGLDGGAYSVPGVADASLFGDGATPAVDQLAWHPGDSTPEFTVLRWTAGVGEAGSIRLEGAFSKLGEPNGTVDFFIFVNGLQAYAQTGVVAGSTYDYDFTANILTGQSVDFVLGANVDGFGGDESLVSGTITSAIPEPSTYAILAGLAALGLALRRRLKMEGDSALSHTV